LGGFKKGGLTKKMLYRKNHYNRFLKNNCNMFGEICTSSFLLAAKKDKYQPVTCMQMIYKSLNGNDQKLSAGSLPRSPASNLRSQIKRQGQVF